MTIRDVFLEGGLTFKKYVDRKGRGLQYFILKDFREDVIYGWPLSQSVM